MIVVKTWCKCTPLMGHVKSKWMGVFLFGFIPLYLQRIYKA